MENKDILLSAAALFWDEGLDSPFRSNYVPFLANFLDFDFFVKTFCKL